MRFVCCMRSIWDLYCSPVRYALGDLYIRVQLEPELNQTNPNMGLELNPTYPNSNPSCTQPIPNSTKAPWVGIGLGLTGCNWSWAQAEPDLFFKGWARANLQFFPIRPPLVKSIYHNSSYYFKGKSTSKSGNHNGQAWPNFLTSFN